ncbi:11819_t:CDS:2 [Gigaspora rosea]|nr:11819_t:CDS:2 [Gigaspora rosea]
MCLGTGTLSQQAEAPVASTSRTFKTSEPPETVNKKPEANSLLDYIEDIGTIYDGDFELDPLVRFFYPALIPPRIIWEEEEVKAWRNDVLIKFLHHPNLASSKHRPGALYDVFIKLTTNPQRGQDPYPYRPHHLTQKWELHRFWSVNSCEEVANKCSQIEALLSSDSEIGALEILG